MRRREISFITRHVSKVLSDVRKIIRNNSAVFLEVTLERNCLVSHERITGTYFCHSKK